MYNVVGIFSGAYASDVECMYTSGPGHIFLVVSSYGFIY